MPLDIRVHHGQPSEYSLAFKPPEGLEPMRALYNEGIGAKLPTEALQAAFDSYLRSEMPKQYPDANLEAKLLEALSNYCGAPTNFIGIFDGSDAIIEKVALCASLGALPAQQQASPSTSPSRYFVLGPTYSQAQNFAARFGCEVMTAIGPGPRFDIDPQELRTEIESLRPDVCYICNPNNPTGLILDPTTIGILCQSNQDTLFLVDEAYVEFGGLSSQSLIFNHKNLAIARTFSKAFALADLRLGYLIAHPDFHAALRPFKNDKDVSSLSMALGSAVLQHPEYVRDHVNEVAKQKLRIIALLEQHGFTPLAGGGNFVAFHTPASYTKQFIERCYRYGLAIRDLSSLSPGLVRITLINDIVSDAFERVFPQNADPAFDATCEWLK